MKKIDARILDVLMIKLNQNLFNPIILIAGKSILCDTWYRNVLNVILSQ